MNQFQDFHKKYLSDFNQYLHDQLTKEISEPHLQAGMLYSLEAGGKRLRPFLMLGVIKSLDDKVDVEKYFRIAGAIELLHTYSLIHDDLPAMDNSDLRRGVPTNHKKFTEAQAILNGDGLLTHAFSWLAHATIVDSRKQIELVKILADSAGPLGMVKGQMLDITNTGKQLNLEQITELDAGKTGALIQAAVLMGAVCVDATEKQNKYLKLFAQKFGVAFQIYDDLMDLLSDTKTMGKEVRHDEAVGKNTYPEVLGVPGAETKLKTMVQNAHKDLDAIQLDKSILSDSLGYFDLGD